MIFLKKVLTKWSACVIMAGRARPMRGEITIIPHLADFVKGKCCTNFYTADPETLCSLYIVIFCYCDIRLIESKKR